MPRKRCLNSCSAASKQPVLRSLALVLMLALAMAGRAEVALVTGNDYEPFADRSLPDGGLSTRLVRAAFAAAGTGVSVDYQPWLRGYRATLMGDFAATYPYVYSQQRAAEMRFSDPIMTIDTLVVSRASHPLHYHSPSSLQGTVMCQAQGWAPPDSISQAVARGDIEMMDAAQYDSCFRMLMAGRVDFLLSNNLQWAVQAGLNEMQPGDFHVADRPVQSSRHHLIAPRTPAGEAVIETFNRGLDSLRASGEFDRLVASYPLLRPKNGND